MEDLDRIAAFASVVDAGSFSAAARNLGVSKSFVSKKVRQLEASLGARLLNRTTRALSLTQAGAVFHARCARALEELSDAKRAVGHLVAAPRGVLRVSTSVAFGRLHVASALPGFLAAFPEVEVDMVTTDRLVDLVDEGFDLALRIVLEPSPNLVARKLAPVRRKLCATTDYLAEHGMPRDPHELAHHNCLTYTHFAPEHTWRLRTPTGDEVPVRVAGNLRINDDDALAEAVYGGLGIALLPTFIVGSALQAGRLRSVLDDHVPLDRSVYAVYLPNRHLSAKVRAFIDHLLDRIGAEPYWDRS